MVFSASDFLESTFIVSHVVFSNLNSTTSLVHFSSIGNGNLMWITDILLSSFCI
jgi:hypothetical protein